MIADLKPCRAMKDSGVEWLGEVPEHWDLVPNRTLMRLKEQVVDERADDYTLLSPLGRFEYSLIILRQRQGG